MLAGLYSYLKQQVCLSENNRALYSSSHDVESYGIREMAYFETAAVNVISYLNP